MKILKSSLCIMFLCALISSSYGQAANKVTLMDVGSGIFKLIYRTTGQDNVKVTLLDNSNHTIFTETLYKTGSFARPYNLNDEDGGDFKIVVEDKDGKTEKNFSYAVNKVESNIDVSKIANAQNKYLLSVENKDADQISVRIYDSEKNLIHEQSIRVNGKFSVVYNLEKVKDRTVFEVAGSNGVAKTFTF
ncbi:MAG: hypothetical protein QM734_17270 [Cyclobacteriaceae bacterium]